MLLAMCGVKAPAGVTCDGLDRSAALVGGPPARDRVFCHFPHGGAGRIEWLAPGAETRTWEF